MDNRPEQSSQHAPRWSYHTDVPNVNRCNRWIGLQTAEARCCRGAEVVDEHSIRHVVRGILVAKECVE